MNNKQKESAVDIMDLECLGEDIQRLSSLLAGMSYMGMDTNFSKQDVSSLYMLSDQIREAGTKTEELWKYSHKLHFETISKEDHIRFARLIYAKINSGEIDRAKKLLEEAMMGSEIHQGLHVTSPIEEKVS